MNPIDKAIASREGFARLRDLWDRETLVDLENIRFSRNYLKGFVYKHYTVQYLSFITFLSIYTSSTAHPVSKKTIGNKSTMDLSLTFEANYSELKDFIITPFYSPIKAYLDVEISSLEGKRNIAIVMNANSFESVTDIDYFITNVNPKIVTPEWVVKTYSQRNWVEVFYREAKVWLGLKEYQVRHKRSLLRRFIKRVLCLYFYSLA